jgi:hypothetical protein
LFTSTFTKNYDQTSKIVFFSILVDCVFGRFSVMRGPSKNVMRRSSEQTFFGQILGLPQSPCGAAGASLALLCLADRLIFGLYLTRGAEEKK